MTSLPIGPSAPSSDGSPLVSVVIPTYNRLELLDGALQSVAEQELHGRLEVIVVNDGGLSADPVVEGWRGRLPVTLIDMNRRTGPAGARNAGLKHAAGDYIAFLDDDDLFLPGHLAAGCEVLEHGDADLVYTGAIVSNRRLTALPPDLSGFPLKAYPYDHRFLLVANYVHTGSVIVRSFRDTPVRFDESLEVCEDWDLWLALTVSLDYRVSFVDKITCVYHQVPEVRGLVAGGQLSSPSKFAVARDYLNAKWPVDDAFVRDHREWMVELERFRSDLIAQEQRMPNLLFDEILAYLHERMSRGAAADYADIGRFFHRG